MYATRLMREKEEREEREREGKGRWVSLETK